jgi:hypothetical protein
MDLNGHTERMKFLVRDRDSKFVAAPAAVFQSVGIRVLKTSVRAPRANAIMERWVGSCRRETLDRTPIWNLPEAPMGRSPLSCPRPSGDKMCRINAVNRFEG